LKKYFALACILTLTGLLILSGCGVFSGPGSKGQGMIQILTEIPQDDLNKVEDLDGSHLKNIIFTVSQGSQMFVHFEKIDSSSSNVKAFFEDLKNGTWEVKIVVEDRNGYEIFSGYAEAVIEANAVTDISVDIDLTSSRVNFEVSLPQGNNLRGDIVLKNNQGETRREELNINGGAGSVQIPNLAPQNWQVGLEIKDGTGETLFDGFSSQVLKIYPGRDGDAFLNLSSFGGQIYVDTNWLPIPEPVVGLEGLYKEGGLNLSWNPVNSNDLEGYRVFRSTEKDGIMKALNPELTEKNEFFDEEIKGGQDYFYWVVAYTENGYSSRLNDPYEIYIEIIEGVWGKISVKHDFPPPVFSSQNGFNATGPAKEAGLFKEPPLEPVPGEMIVSFSSLSAMGEVKSQIEAMGAEILDKNERVNAFLVRVEEGDVQTSSFELMNINGVRYVEPNYRMYALGTNPNDPRYEQQWHYPLIRLPQTWNITTGDRNLRIAVLDTGCDANHPDLGPRLDTSNGYNFVEENNNTHDIHGHGTHVAGTIGAVTDNNLGVAGVMWSGEILPVKVLGDDGSGSYWAVGNGMLYAAGILDGENMPNNPSPVDVINMSLGGSSSSDFIAEVVQEVHATGVIMVAAAGNSGGAIGYPAKYPEVIAVGSLDHHSTDELKLASYSSRGPELDIAAPGGAGSEGVLSTIPGEGYDAKMGTSMAAPHVAGVIGLMLAEGIPASQVRDIIKDTATVFGPEVSGLAGGGIPPGDGDDKKMDFGLINAYWAINNVAEIKVFLGTRTGDTINSVVEANIDNLKGGNYSFSAPPPGTYRVFAWIDVRGNGKIESGDYLAQSEEITFRAGDKINLNLTLREIIE